MAYKYWSQGQTNVGGLTSFLTGNGPLGFDGLEPMMLNMGWVLVDGGFVAANDFAVFKSNGEDGDKPYGYIHIWKDIAGNRLRFQAYMDWNATTHTGIQGTGYYGSVAINTGDFPVWIWGDKNLVVLKTNISGYSTGMFGHVPLRWSHCSLVTKTTDAITAGSAVSIPVASSGGFEVGKSYQLVGVNKEGQDYVEVSGLTATTITVTTLNKNFASGAWIGVLPLAFFNTKDSSHNELCWVHYTGVTGDSATDGYWDLGFDQMVSVGDSDPDGRSGTYPLQVLTFGDRGVADAHPGFTIGRSSSKFFRLPISGGISNDDLVYQGRTFRGTSTGSNTSSSLNDTGASWISNAYTNKTIVILSGVGQGQIRLISGNTSTQISVSPAWVITPDDTSVYAVCDSAYRISSVSGLSGCYLAIAEADPGWIEPSKICLYRGAPTGDVSGTSILGATTVKGTSSQKWQNYGGVVLDLIGGDPSAPHYSGFSETSLCKMTRRGGSYEVKFRTSDWAFPEKACALFIFGADSTYFSDFNTSTFYSFGVYYLSSAYKVGLFLNTAGDTKTLLASSGSVSVLVPTGSWIFSREGTTFRAVCDGVVVFQYSDNTIPPSDTRCFCGSSITTTDGTANSGNRPRLREVLAVHRYPVSSVSVSDQYTLSYEDTIVGKTGGVPNVANIADTLIYADDTMKYTDGSGTFFFASGSSAKFSSRGGMMDLSLNSFDGTLGIFFLYGSDVFSTYSTATGYNLYFSGNPTGTLKFGSSSNAWATNSPGSVNFSPYYSGGILQLRIVLDYDVVSFYAGPGFSTKVSTMNVCRKSTMIDSAYYVGFNFTSNNTNPVISGTIPFRIWQRIV